MIERHPLQPFLPQNARVLFLGSFPPPLKRWSMDFFYPNFNNDFWRIAGLIFTGDRNHFILPGEKRFNKEMIADFCTTNGIAIFDTASAVNRQKGNASDKFLEVVEPTAIESLLEQIPACRDIVTTGQKATDVIIERYGCNAPSIGSYTDLTVAGRPVHFWRMPSTSRAYPLPLENKAAAYRKLFESLGCDVNR